MRRSIRSLLILLFSIVLLYSGYRISVTYWGYARSEAARDALIDLAVSSYDGTGESCVSLPDSHVMNAKTDSAMAAAPCVDFDALRRVNPDIVAWLYCQGTSINYPIVRGGDNTYYLDHLITGEFNNSGTLFMDWRCTPDFSDINTVVYGHHMKNGGMFASIVKYRSQEYYDMHSEMYLLTPVKEYRLEIFSGHITSPDSQSYSIRFEQDTDFETFLGDAVEKSDFISDIKPTLHDRIITFSTCTYEYDDARYVVHAILKSIDD